MRIFLLSLNFGFATGLLLSCIAPFINPEKAWLIAFFGLGFPFFFAVNILWLFFWAVLRKPYAFISLAILALSIFNLRNQVAIASCSGENDLRDKFTVMNYNVKTFGLYNWTHNVELKNEMLKLIEMQDADVVCLQEFYTDDSEEFDILEILNKKYPYVHFHRTLTLRKHQHWGIVTFSRHPITDTLSFPFTNSKHNIAIATDVLVGTDTIRIFNAHLQSIHFGKKDYEGVKNIGGKNTEELHTVESIFKKLKEAFVKRAVQADALKTAMNKSAHKVILCADFNDSPNSYTYRTISKGLTDTFKKAGCGAGTTYAGPFPSFRIDFILCDKSIEAGSHEVIKNPVSDHYPVIASFDL